MVNLCGWFVSVGVRRDRYGGGTPNAHIPSSWGGVRGKIWRRNSQCTYWKVFPAFSV